MKVLVSGSSGMVGSAVVEALAREGLTVCRLARPESPTAHQAESRGVPLGPPVRWDPVTNQFDSSGAEGAEAIVNLAGASIGEGRWTHDRKQVLRRSRVGATRHLVSALSKLKQPPKAFISASAMGYYGDRGEEELTEESPPGKDFLALLARDWEAAAARAGQFGARVILLRFGLILARHGGALPRMLPPFRWGLGGRLGSGRQWTSWLTLSEAVSIIRFALENSQLGGPVNSATPNPVRNAEFTKALGKVLHRPTIFPVPGMALRTIVGEMADALLLASQRLVPTRLKAVGYNFRQPDLLPALEAVLRGPA